jgi:hypothetical protein
VRGLDTGTVKRQKEKSLERQENKYIVVNVISCITDESLNESVS